MPPEFGDDDVVRITTAARNPAEELSRRQSRYVLAMLIRVVCLGLAVWAGPGWLMVLLIAAAVGLPAFAVMDANAPDRRESPFSLDGVAPDTALTEGTSTAAAPLAIEGIVVSSAEGADQRMNDETHEDKRD